MLALTRTTGELLYIGDAVTVEVTSTNQRRQQAAFRVEHAGRVTRFVLWTGDAETLAEGVRLMLLSVRSSGKARVGIEAPRELAIVRSEVLRPRTR